MKIVIMTPDPLATVPEENKTTKLFTQTNSTSALYKLRSQLPNLIAGAAFSNGILVISSGLFVGSFYQDKGFIFTLIAGGLLSLGSLGGALYYPFKIVKTRKQQKLAISQATTEVSSWLKGSYEVKVSDYIALELAENMSVANKDSRTWAWRFSDWTYKPYILRCNPEGLFYIENADGQKTLTQTSETVAESIKSLTLHASNPALTETDTQLLESMQTKANSLLTSDTTAEAKAIVGQVAAEALKAVELNETLTKLSPEKADSELSSILRLLDAELDSVLSKEVAQVKQKMERQKLYVHSRQQSEIASKLKLNSESLTK